MVPSYYLIAPSFEDEFKDAISIVEMRMTFSELLTVPSGHLRNKEMFICSEAFFDHHLKGGAEDRINIFQV
jgi:hypothetical protein